MPTPKPSCAAAFRQQMVELVRAGRGVTDLAREFGCNASSIHAWVKAAGGVDGSGATSSDAPLSMNERQELIELRRKFEQVQQERDILAKATAWFAGKSEKTSMSSPAPAAGRTAQAGDAGATGGAPHDHALPARPGWAQV